MVASPGRFSIPSRSWPGEVPRPKPTTSHGTNTRTAMTNDLPEPPPGLGRVVADTADGLTIDAVTGLQGSIYRAWHNGEVLRQWEDRSAAAWFLAQWINGDRPED